MNALRNLAKRTVFMLRGSYPAIIRRVSHISQCGFVTILNLHRVAPDDGSSYRPLSPTLFEEMLEFVNRNFSVVTFSELDEIRPLPKMILSFDDGYKDFVDYAVPLLDKYRLRVNQNVIPQCAETGLPPLNVIAQDFVGKAPSALVDTLKVPGFGRPRDRSQLGLRLSAFIKNRCQSEQQALAAVLMPQFCSWDKFKPTLMMTPEECQQVASSHEIGGHSYTHASMEFETDDYLRSDLSACREWFRRNIGGEMSIYALPNGSYRAYQLEIIRKAGVRHILLVGEKFALDGSQEDTYPRFTFDARSRSEMRVKVTGGTARVSL